MSYSSANVKLSKTKLSKIEQLGRISSFGLSFLADLEKKKKEPAKNKHIIASTVDLHFKVKEKKNKNNYSR